jgi:hypothetical protein
MAKDEKSMLARMSEGKLPANRQSELPASREPRDPSEKAPRSETRGAKGKTPEEVLGERAERQEAPVATQPAEEQESKPVKTWKVKGEELTLDEIAAKGYMEDLITRAEQYSYLNKKHTELVEGLANQVAKPAEKAAPAQAEQPKLTPKQILDYYTPAVKRSAEEGFIEPELPDVYPLLMSSLMYFRDVLEADNARLQAVVQWIEGEMGVRKQREVEYRINRAVDEVAAMDGKIFEMLRKPDIRKKFIDWLYSDVDLQVKDIQTEKIQTYYLAFNGELLKEMLKNVEQPKETAPRRNIRGDGSTAAPGGVDAPVAPKTMLQRMTEARLGPEQ